MLRNGYRTVVKRSSFHQLSSIREISGSCTRCSKNSFTANRQGKILSKLFGERVAGSKKRWYPTTDAEARPKHGGSLLFKATQLGKPGGAGKNTTRRSAVLNKLFMEEISGLLATGSIADNFLGRGLQLTRVKIAPDFACVNVYWLGTGDPLGDNKLSEDLQRYSGFLRHELSQLRVMGEVPRIHFVQDKTFANIEHVEALLRNLNLSQEDSDSEENTIDFQQGAAARVKREFYGNKDEGNTQTEQEESLPPMRHDVFGLDHYGIMTKILTKTRKTKLAWEIHKERQIAAESASTVTVENKEALMSLKNVEQQIQEANNSSGSEAFKKFLAQRRERKSTPERKKYRKEDNISLIDVHHDDFNDSVASKKQRDILNQEDYLHEDIGNERKL